MTNPGDRPHPEDLLHLANAADQDRGKGKLKVFFGACAGVGKTYTMLQNAQRLREQGFDVVVGFVETHGRLETAAMLTGLEVLPRRTVEHRGHLLEEFDVDAALSRAPAILLVDELAHSNVPGSRHPKRWQDVEELVAAGIEVHSTLNVQHLESINDVVNTITGIPVWETVPDRVFDGSNDVVLVDLPPEDLLQRLREGKVYLPDQAERAIKSFFRKGNLVALRELALRRTADRVDDDIRLYRRDTSGGRIWRTRERLLACIGPAPGSDTVLRNASRMASALNAEWHAVFVETPSDIPSTAANRDGMMDRLRLAENLGAITATVSDQSVVSGIAAYASRNNITKLVIGRSPAKRFWKRSERDFSRAVTACLPEVDVVIVAGEASMPRPAPKPGIRSGGKRYRPYLIAAAASFLTALVLLPVQQVVDSTNIAMLFLAALIPLAMTLGRGPATLASLLNVLAFDILFVEPHYSLAVADVQYVLTFAVMLTVGVIIARLTARLKFQVSIGAERERQTRELYELARQLSAALTAEQIAVIVQRAVSAHTGGDAAILLPDAHDRLYSPPAATMPGIELGPAQWAYDRALPAGADTDTLPGCALHYLPLKAPVRVRGVLALQLPHPRLLRSTALRQQLDTIAALAAIALERVHFVAVAQDTLVTIESQRLRESVLSALSHDLRTPVTAIAGIAESLANHQSLHPAREKELIDSLHLQASAMARLVTNILDMARFESGRQNLLRPDWQSLEELVGAARNALGEILNCRSVAISIPADFPLLRVDGVLFERVLINLLENAAKYVPQQKTIGVTARVTGSNAEIAIWDDGPGLPPGDLERLFTKFERGGAESSVPGVGLGLAICRAIVAAHQGTITARRRAGGGAEFVLQMPLEPMPVLESEPTSELGT